MYIYNSASLSCLCAWDIVSEQWSLIVVMGKPSKSSPSLQNYPLNKFLHCPHLHIYYATSICYTHSSLLNSYHKVRMLHTDPRR